MGNELAALNTDLVCPACRAPLTVQTAHAVCTGCGARFPIRGGIPDFRRRDTYWCNVDREKMRTLNALATANGDWMGSAERMIPRYVDHFRGFERADSQFLWPGEANARVLDAGSMWGGLTLPVAQYHRDVFAVDQTLETLEFLTIRARQMGFDNIHPVASPLHRLPFPDGFFDIAVLNGVLEWVGVDEDVVLETQWRKNWMGLRLDGNRQYARSPEQMQRDVLVEMRRILKPGGHLVLAIENRIGYIYLAGWPDDHMNLPFICFLPRPLARLVTRLTLGCDYRTYVYTIAGYRRLLRSAGFDRATFFGAFNHYIDPTHIVPLDRIRHLKKDILTAAPRPFSWLLRVIPKVALKHVTPSVLAIAPAATGASGLPRIQRLFSEAGIIFGACPAFRAVKCVSRPGSDTAVNFMVFTDDGGVPAYFCKISRRRAAPDILTDEAGNLTAVQRLLTGSPLLAQVPDLVYFGTIDGVTMLVTRFVHVTTAGFDFNNRLSPATLRHIDDPMRRAIDFLCAFQRATRTRVVDAREHLLARIAKQRGLLVSAGGLDGDIAAAIDALSTDVDALKDAVLPLCGVHGDYDFFYNVMFQSKTVRVFDFEHFEPEGLPFTDPVMLVFTPLLVSRDHLRGKRRLPALLADRHVATHVRRWLDNYAAASGIPPALMRIAPALAALHQKTKPYPHYRNPETIPIFRHEAFLPLLQLRLDPVDTPLERQA